MCLFLVTGSCFTFILSPFHVDITLYMSLFTFRLAFLLFLPSVLFILLPFNGDINVYIPFLLPD